MTRLSSRIGLWLCAPLLMVAAGCSGSSGATGAANFSCAPEEGATTSLCLFNCSLGCSTTGCLRTDIAQNEILILQFSDNLDPNTVNSSTVQLRTAAGELPVGDFFVNGNQIEFVPTLLVSGGQTFFGFKPGEVYTLTIPGQRTNPDTLRSASGFAFAETFTCSLVASQGIQDLNGVPPAAELISPSVLVDVPVDTIIELAFNEMVDVTPFQAGSPVTFEVRRTVPGPNGAVCDPASDPINLPGTPRLTFDPARRASVLTFQAAQPLPANVCVEINVTSAVVDLAGKPAQPQTFTFTTKPANLTEEELVEEFDNDDQLDPDRSGGSWGGGVATFARIGGDGRHGDFSTDLGTFVGTINGKDTYEIRTDNTIIPEESTLSGSPVAVTDGRFFFSSMVVPGSVRVRFIGPVAPIVTVAGKIDVLGEIDIDGESLDHPGTSSAAGQPGGVAGVFGGAGGDGGDKCFGTGALPAHQGKDGEDGGVIAGRAYANSVLGTGGKGSVLFPLDGLKSSLYYAPSPTTVSYSPTASAPGAGGGNRQPGEQGLVTNNNHVNPATNMTPNPAYFGPPADGGSAVQFFPFPAPTGSTKSSVHFVVGGAGGGGAASNGALSIDVIPAASAFVRGAGGGGGGGAIALRAGDNLTVGPLAKILANGGSTGGITSTFGTSSAMPGGGGAGGSIVLQSGRAANIAGEVNVAGGLGGAYDRSSGTSAPPLGARVEAKAGDGSPGFLRFELPVAPTPQDLPNAVPPAAAENVAELTENDQLSSSRSLWYSTGLVFGPDFSRYEIHATVDTGSGPQQVVFSDDQTAVPGSLPAGAGQAVRLFLQAGQIDLSTGIVADIRPWRTGVRSTQNITGIASDGRNAFRFVIIQDHDIATTVTIDKIVIVYLV